MTVNDNRALQVTLASDTAEVVIDLAQRSNMSVDGAVNATLRCFTAWIVAATQYHDAKWAVQILEQRSGALVVEVELPELSSEARLRKEDD